MSKNYLYFESPFSGHPSVLVPADAFKNARHIVVRSDNEKNVQIFISTPPGNIASDTYPDFVAKGTPESVMSAIRSLLSEERVPFAQRAHIVAARSNKSVPQGGYGNRRVLNPRHG